MATNNLLTLFLLLSIIFTIKADLPHWNFKCENNICSKVPITNIAEAQSLSVCRLLCNANEIGVLWPKPTGVVKFEQKLSKISLGEINFVPYGFQGEVVTYLEKSKSRFLQQLSNKMYRGVTLNQKDSVPVYINLHISSSSSDLNYETNESYELRITKKDFVIVTIFAESFYGARNGLETLSQLIVFDDIHNDLLIPSEVEIHDAPTYKHRGVILDTSRSYFPVDAIKRTIDALAMVKMNTFHWHITDSHSFPILLKSVPELGQLGAYSPSQVYTETDIRELVQFGKARGVRIIPEFDAPAHVGEGWQNTNLTACFNAQPWQKYCKEPPCGQLDPTKEKLYDVLEKIYGDFVDYFHPMETAFHMGGDEVDMDCWKSSDDIKNWMEEHGLGLTKSDFMKLWGEFQEKALERFDKVAKKRIPAILWTSLLTEKPYLMDYLNKERYIIQIWTDAKDPQVKAILENGFKVIISNYDALYLDCGFAGWVQGGNNWCSPYIGWQKIYDNDLRKMGGSYHNQVLGGEAALWSEQADVHTLDSRLWPRVSALAERLWTDPTTSWRDSESRFLVHREHLVQNGIQAELIQPQWCLQNEENCPRK
ncbi:chitooligosaccharidolytic beta-N-acetylglucosaminidase-like [Culicoides brevitarsis]|uniref:chitooligosaccharidolytic beta-N-acetylglucosaminidase-like n=1 Tax=Culicoides brevitarsis TaxID=469753 RepID=UPI00307BB47C